jgi:hypothetical protein
MERSIETINVLGEPVRIKTGSLGGRILNAQPEYEDALAVARKKGLPLKDVLRRAAAAQLNKD